MKRALIALATAGFCIAGPAAADAPTSHRTNIPQLAAKTEMPRAGKIVMDGAWARATVSKNGVVYAAFINKGTTDDRLIGGRTSIAKRVELHTTVIKNDIMRMRPIKAIAVPAGKKVSMTSGGGDHIMLVGLNRKLRHGDDFKLTLIFEKSGEVTFIVSVFPGAAKSGKHKSE